MKNKIINRLLTFLLAFSMVLTGFMPGFSNNIARAEQTQELEIIDEVQLEHLEIDNRQESKEDEEKPEEGQEKEEPKEDEEKPEEGQEKEESKEDEEKSEEGQEIEEPKEDEEKPEEEQEKEEPKEDEEKPGEGQEIEEPKEDEEKPEEGQEKEELKEDEEKSEEGQEKEEPKEDEEKLEEDQDIIPGEVIVKFKDDVVSECSINSIAFVNGVKNELDDSGVYVLNTNENINKVVKELEENPDVEYVEPNRKYYIFDDVDVTKSNDKYINEQWALEDLKAPKTWGSIGELSGQVTVAVVDSGVDYNHPDLKGKLLEGKNFAKRDGFGGYYPPNRGVLDDKGHGTFVSGVISAIKNNGIGIAGVTGDYNVKILPVKVMNDRGFGSTFDISQGIRYAADQDVDIINLSLGGKGYSNTMAEAVRYAQDKGILVVAASGNEGDDASKYYPASLPGVLTVGAIDKRGNIGNFSNFGSKVDVYAPGVNIVSTTIKWDGTMGNEEEGYYSRANGTSFSAPYIAGVAAIYKIKNPNASAGEIIEAIKSSAEKSYDKTKKMDYLKANMYQTLVSDVEYKNYIKLLLPRVDSYVSNKVELKAQLIKDIHEVDKVAFYLDEIEGENKICEIDNDDNKEIYNYEWNIDEIQNGKHKIIAVAYSENEIKDSESVSICVMNEAKTGLILKVKDPSGELAINAQVQLYSKNVENEQKSYKEIWTGLTNNEGLIRIPNTIIDDMNEYRVLINGKFDFKNSPEGSTLFIYNRKVQTPGTIEIDGQNTIPIKFNTKDRNGKILSDVKYYATAADENSIKIGTTSSLNEETYDCPIIYMDKGKYDLFAYSGTEDETYFLNKLGKDINKGEKELIFDGKKTGKIILDSSSIEDVINSYIYLYNEYTEASIGISGNQRISGENIYVSAGKYNYAIKLEVKDCNEESNWIYGFDSMGKKVNIQESKDNKVSIGKNIKLAKYELARDFLKNYCERMGKTYKENEIIESEKDGIKTYKIPRKYTMAYTRHVFADENGNELVGIYKGRLGEKEIDICEDIQVQNLEEISPKYKVKNMDNGSIAYERVFSSFYQYAFWYIANPNFKPGKYSVELTLEKNPLAKEGIHGKMINEIYDAKAKTLKLKDEKGNTIIPYTWIYRLEEDEKGNSYWEQSYGLWSNRWGDNVGEIVLDSGVKLSDKKNGNIAVFHFKDEKYDKEVFVFRTFTTLDELSSKMTVNTKDLQLAKINPIDKNKDNIDALYRTQNIIIDKEELKIPFSHNLDLFYKDGIYLEPEVYSFNGIYITPKDENGKYSSYYLIANDVKINRDNHKAILDGSNTAKINVDVNKGDYNSLRGIGLLPFNKYQYSISSYDVQGNIFYVSSDIKYDNVKLVYVLSDPEKEEHIWSYFVNKKDWTGKVFKKGEEYTLKYGVEFKPSIKLKKNSLSMYDSIEGNTSILDEYGNKINQAKVTRGPHWIMDLENKSSDYSYRCLPNGDIRIETNILENNDYSIQNCPFSIRTLYPHLRIYKIEKGEEKLIFNETKKQYFQSFNETLNKMEEGEYRVELAFSAGPQGIITTSNNDGLFKVKKSNSENNDNDNNNDENSKSNSKDEDGRSSIGTSKSKNNTKKINKHKENQRQEEVKISMKQNNASLLNDEVKIKFKKGTFDKETSIRGQVINKNKVVLPKINNVEKYNLVGKIYNLETKSKDIKNPIKLTLKYDKTKIEDTNKLGIYKYDEKTNIWDYVGGKIDRKENSITAEINHFGQYTIMEYDRTFNDIQNHWAKEDIELMASKHVIEGVEHDKFEPQSNITRAEFATILVRALGIEDVNYEENVFTDISKDEWYARYVNIAYKEGIVDGVSESRFDANAEITREQMITMIMRSYNKLTNNDYNDLMLTTELRFKDEADISSWAYQAAVVGESLGIVEGKDGNLFASKDKATRAEAVIMLRRLLEVTNNL